MKIERRRIITLSTLAVTAAVLIVTWIVFRSAILAGYYAWRLETDEREMIDRLLEFG